MSSFLEEISILSHSTVFLYFFALITEEGFLISPCFSVELCIQMGISFLFFFAFSVCSQLIVSPPQTTVSLFCLILCPYFYVLISMYQLFMCANVEECKRHSMGPRSSLPSDH